MRTTDDTSTCTPHAARAQPDALSDVLQSIHLSGREVWCAEAGAEAVVERRRGERVLYVVRSGTLEVTTNGRSVVLQTDGLAFIPTGAAHQVRAEPGSTWLTGTFDVEEATAEPILNVLPAVIVITASDERGPWFEIAKGLVLEEMPVFNPGGRVMVSRVLDLFFIRILRHWAAHQRHESAGLLAAVLDPVISRAVAAIHRQPGRAWTVDELADRTGLARSTFAARFTELVGTPPGRYAAERRLAHAEHLLQTTDRPIAEISSDAGYASEAAFSRAFGQLYGSSPRTWRSGQGTDSPSPTRAGSRRTPTREDLPR